MPRRIVLHVEDDDATAFLFRLALQEISPDSVQVHRASDGEEALAFLSRTGPHRNAPRPDLILLDLNLPKVSGLNLLSRLHAEESLRLIPVVVFTTSSLEADRKASLALGARQFVTKPPTFELLLELMKAAVCVA